jgi:hypothetical protein
LIALAVGGTDWATWLRQQSYTIAGIPHIEFADIDAFILAVRKKTGVNAHHGVPGKGKPDDKYEPLSRLTILSHGTFDGPVMGSGHGDILTRERVLGRTRSLAAMRLCFQPGAEVVFGGCLIGTNPWLLADLSVLWGGVRVTAFTALQKLGTPYYSGDQVTLRNRTLIAGRNTPAGRQFLAHPNMKPGRADTHMGD